MNVYKRQMLLQSIQIQIKHIVVCLERHFVAEIYALFQQNILDWKAETANFFDILETSEPTIDISNT